MHAGGGALAGAGTFFCLRALPTRGLLTILPASCTNTNIHAITITFSLVLLRPLRPPACRSVFFISHDDKFVIKTMRKEEVRQLLAMLPRYAAHVAAHPGTLLTRFYGVHRVKPSHGSKVCM